MRMGVKKAALGSQMLPDFEKKLPVKGSLCGSGQLFGSLCGK